MSLNAKETKSLMMRISHDVQHNTIFDQVRKIMEMIRLDGKELTDIARSMTRGMLDAASEREGSRIIKKIAAPLSPLLTKTRVKEMITTMSKAQGTKINLLFEEDSRDCREATSKVSFITAQPMIVGTSTYVEEDEEIFMGGSDSGVLA